MTPNRLTKVTNCGDS